MVSSKVKISNVIFIVCTIEEEEQNKMNEKISQGHNKQNLKMEGYLIPEASRFQKRKYILLR